MEKYNTIKLLVEAFDAHDLKYQVIETDEFFEEGVSNSPEDFYKA